MRVSFDTNILIYAEDVGFEAADRAKVDRSRDLIVRCRQTQDIVLPAQVLAELHFVSVKKRRLSRDPSAQRVRGYAAEAVVIATRAELFDQALTPSAAHDVPTFDAIVLAAAVEAGCDVLYSDDFQHGFVWRGVEVVNPFR